MIKLFTYEDLKRLKVSESALKWMAEHGFKDRQFTSVEFLHAVLEYLKARAVETDCVYDKQFCLPEAIRKAKELKMRWIYRSIDDGDWVTWFLDIQEDRVSNMVDLESFEQYPLRICDLTADDWKISKIKSVDVRVIE